MLEEKQMMQKMCPVNRIVCEKVMAAGRRCSLLLAVGKRLLGSFSAVSNMQSPSLCMQSQMVQGDLYMSHD